MVAVYRGDYWFRGLPIKMFIVKRTKNGKTAHLFTDFSNPAANGYRIAYCNRDGCADTGLSSKNGNWTDAPDLKICNNCMRTWRKEQRKWHGTP